MDDEAVHALVGLGLVSIAALLTVTMVAVIRRVLLYEMEDMPELPPQPPGSTTFLFIAWIRCDSIGKPTFWRPVAGGDDPTEMLANVELYHPLERYDHLVLPNGERPSGD